MFLSVGRLVSPCCLRQLAQDILFVMRTCREHHILCELQEGTLLGAVKLGKVLPWERDADITFLSANFTAILQLKAYLQKHGYSISVTDPVTCCRDGLLTGGTIKLQGARWPIELWGTAPTRLRNTGKKEWNPDKNYLPWGENRSTSQSRIVHAQSLWIRDLQACATLDGAGVAEQLD